MKWASHHSYLKNFRKVGGNQTTYLADDQSPEKGIDGTEFITNVLWKLPSRGGSKVLEETLELTSPSATIDCSHRDSYTLGALKSVYTSDIEGDFMSATKLREINSGGKVTTLFKSEKYSYKTTGNQLTITTRK